MFSEIHCILCEESNVPNSVYNMHLVMKKMGIFIHSTHFLNVLGIVDTAESKALGCSSGAYTIVGKKGNSHIYI